MSHKTRLRINKEYNETGARGRHDAVWVEKSERPSPNEPQDFWLYPGLILIAYISNGKQDDVHNGQLFETLEIMPTAVMMRDAEAHTIHELSLEFMRHNQRSGFAFTNVGCQGRSLGDFATLDTPERGITLWDIESPYFSLKHVFIGTSRSRSGELLQIASSPNFY